MSAIFKSTAPKKPVRKKSTVPHTDDAADDALSLQEDDPIQRRYFRQSLLVIGGAFVVMLFFFLAAFFLAVRGAERTVVPRVVGDEITEALANLQARELYPRVQVKYTGIPADKGQVIAQDPEPGLYVKAGRRVTITVSKGAILDNVEEYVGMNVEDVRSRLATLFSTYEPLLVIQEPVTYVYNDAESGTVLGQYPDAGTPLSHPENLILIVSRGKMDRPIVLPDWEDWSAENAMRSLARLPLPFVFEEDGRSPEGTYPRVRSQNPAPESQVGPNRRVVLRYTPPKSWPEEYRYGLFDRTLPEYPVPVLLEAIIREPGAAERTLFSMPHSGGRVSFPYIVPVGSGIILTINGQEVERLDVLSEE